MRLCTVKILLHQHISSNTFSTPIAFVSTCVENMSVLIGVYKGSSNTSFKSAMFAYCKYMFKASQFGSTARRLKWVPSPLQVHARDDWVRIAPSQWETVLLCKDVSHWLGAGPVCAFGNWMPVDFTDFHKVSRKFGENAWCCQDMEKLSALLSFLGESTRGLWFHKGPVMRSLRVSFHGSLNNLLN